MSGYWSRWKSKVGMFGFEQIHSCCGFHKHCFAHSTLMCPVEDTSYVPVDILLCKPCSRHVTCIMFGNRAAFFIHGAASSSKSKRFYEIGSHSARTSAEIHGISEPLLHDSMLTFICMLIGNAAWNLFHYVPAHLLQRLSLSYC